MLIFYIQFAGERKLYRAVYMSVTTESGYVHLFSLCNAQQASFWKYFSSSLIFKA